MSEQVTIQEVQDARDWSSPDNKIHNTFYQVVIKKADGTEEEVDHARQQGKPEPQPGEELTVIFEPGKYRRRMKKDQSAFTTGSSTEHTRSSTPKREWKPEGQYDPEKVARMSRAHAQEMAIAWTSYRTSQGDDPTGRQGLIEAIDFFEDDVNAAGQKASQGAGAGTTEGGSPASSVVPSTNAPPPEQSSADDTHQWLEDRLVDGGASSYGAGKLASYALEKLNPDALKKYEALLANLDTIGEGTKRLEASYEKAEGEPVPQQEPLDEDIPF